jgi:hypothetical protein
MHHPCTGFVHIYLFFDAAGGANDPLQQRCEDLFSSTVTCLKRTTELQQRLAAECSTWAELGQYYR